MSPEIMKMLYHSHAGSWFITILLFAISYAMFKKGSMKPQKITHMILRVFFIIMILSGIGLVVALQYPVEFVLKGVLAIILIGLMEMILVRSVKGKETKGFWIPLAGVLPLVLLIGFNVIHF